MPPVAVCGRFDNSPAHLIIVSTRFNTGAMNDASRDIDREAIELAREEQREAEHARRQAANTLRAEARKVQAALDRAAKEERARIEKAKLKERNAAKENARKIQAARDALERIKARKRTPEYKAREAARERAKRALCVKEKVPAGYVTMIEAAEGTPMSGAGIRKAVKSGRIEGIKIKKVWYIDNGKAKAYAAGKQDRCKARLAYINSRGKK